MPVGAWSQPSGSSSSMEWSAFSGAGMPWATGFCPAEGWGGTSSWAVNERVGSWALVTAPAILSVVGAGVAWPIVGLSNDPAGDSRSGWLRS